MKSAAMKMTTNSSSVDSSTLALRHADATLRHYKIIVEVCAVGALCTLGIAGNVLSIVVLGRDRTIRRTTGFMLQMLAVADAVFLLDTESTVHVAALDTMCVGCLATVLCSRSVCWLSTDRRCVPGLVSRLPDAQLCRQLDRLAASRCATSVALRRGVRVAARFRRTDCHRLAGGAGDDRPPTVWLVVVVTADHPPSDWWCW